MIDINKSTITNTFEVEILTPIHIGGAGENHWQNGMDFIAKDGKTWILDFNKLCKVIPVDTLTLAFAKVDGKVTIESLLKHTSMESVSSKSFNFPNPSGIELKRHIFNGMDGKPYIPGSSIKGAIASVLINYFSKKAGFEKSKDPSAKLLGGTDNSIMRYFQFTDVPFEETVLKNTKIFNLQKNNLKTWEGGWKHGKDNTTTDFKPIPFTTVYESLVLNDKSEMMLSFKMKAIEQLYLPQNKTPEKNIPPSHTAPWMTNNPTAELCSIINKHTLDFLDKEIKFYQKYQFDANSESAYEELLKLKEKAKNLDSTKACILRLAAGSGFHSITGDWQYDDYIQTGEHQDGKRKYKSRKLAFENGIFWPMGFIKLTLLDEETILKRQKGEVLKKERVALEAAKKAEAEKERLERERIEKEEAKKPKMFEGKVKKGDIIDAEVTKVEGGKTATLKFYATGQESNNNRKINYNGIQVGQIIQVQVNNIAGNGFIVAVEFKKFK